MRKLALPSIHTGDLILVNRNVPVVGEPEELTDLGNGVLWARLWGADGAPGGHPPGGTDGTASGVDGHRPGKRLALPTGADRDF